MMIRRKLLEGSEREKMTNFLGMQLQSGQKSNSKAIYEIFAKGASPALQKSLQEKPQNAHNGVKLLSGAISMPLVYREEESQKGRWREGCGTVSCRVEPRGICPFDCRRYSIPTLRYQGIEPGTFCMPRICSLPLSQDNFPSSFLDCKLLREGPAFSFSAKCHVRG